MTNLRAAPPNDDPLVLGATLRPPKTAELLADQIRQRIVSGDLRLGTALPSETELMKQFTVARPTVREAMRLLEADGLISVRRGASARVTSPDPVLAARLTGFVLQMGGTTFDDVFRTRLLIEPACARHLAGHSTPAAIAALEGALDVEVMGDAAEGDPFGVTFHDVIIEMCGSNTLTVICSMLRHITYAQAAIATDVDRQDPARRASHIAAAHGAHERLYLAVKSGDEHEAERIWRSHLQQLAVVLVDQLGALEVGAVLAAYRP